MSLFKPKTVCESFWPTSVLCWFFGGFPPTVKRRWRILVQTIIVIVDLYLFFFGSANEAKPRTGIFETIFFTTATIIWYERMIMRVGSVFLWEFKGARLREKMIIELTKLDEELKNFGVETNHSKFVWRQLISVVGFKILSLCVVITFETAGKNQWAEISDSAQAGSEHVPIVNMPIIVLLQQFQLISSDLVHLNLLHALRMRFENINEVLRRISNPEYKTRINVRTTYRGARKIGVQNEVQHQRAKTRRDNLSAHFLFEKIDRLCRIHKRLMTAAEEFSSMFSLHLCMSMPIMASFFLLHSFEMLKSLKTQCLSCLVFSVFGPIQNTVMFLYIILSCCNICNEANKLGTLLYRIPIFDAVHHSQEQSVHNLLRKLHITVGSMLAVDQSLVILLFSTVAKYVAVMLQLPKTTGK